MDNLQWGWIVIVCWHQKHRYKGGFCAQSHCLSITDTFLWTWQRHTMAYSSILCGEEGVGLAMVSLLWSCREGQGWYQYCNIFSHGKKWKHEADQTLWSFKKLAVCKILCAIAWKIKYVTMDDNIMMFHSNIRDVFLNKLNPLCVLFPLHDTNEYCNTGIVPALVRTVCGFITNTFDRSVSSNPEWLDRHCLLSSVHKVIPVISVPFYTTSYSFLHV